MKKFIFLLVVLALFSQCNKESNKKNVSEDVTTDIVNKEKIDFDAMKKIIDDSQSMDVEVFIAVSVYHKYYISKYDEETKGLTEEQQKEFFSNKKDEFYKTIKYSEKDYTNFMEKNSTSINNFISTHPEIAEYLTSTN